MLTSKEMIKFIENNRPSVKAIDMISISKNNRKMDNITSFSVFPVLTCPNCQQCQKDCYAVKMCRLYKNVVTSYINNTYLILTNPKTVKDQLIDHCKTVSVFRFNVSGDIFNYHYMQIIYYTAKACPNCKFLVFTKSYKLVSDFFTRHKKPDNLQIIFSKWQNTIYNPLKFPTSDIFTNIDFIQLSQNDFLCGGNCKDCFNNCKGCFNLKSGQNVYFKKH